MFLDADDIMLPRRVEAQVALATRHPTALVGGCWRRHPAGSTEHYERWANALDDPRGLWLEQFREVTVQMPTWCVRRDVFDAVGGFAEAPPNSGEAEDLIFFHAHLDAHGPANVAAGRPSLARAGTPDDPVLLYRWSPDSGTSRVSRRRLLEIRVAAFERRVLSRPEWERFAVWGAAGRARVRLAAVSRVSREGDGDARRRPQKVRRDVREPSMGSPDGNTGGALRRAPRVRGERSRGGVRGETTKGTRRGGGTREKCRHARTRRGRVPLVHHVDVRRDGV